MQPGIKPQKVCFLNFVMKGIILMISYAWDIGCTTFFQTLLLLNTLVVSYGAIWVACDITIVQIIGQLKNQTISLIANSYHVFDQESRTAALFFVVAFVMMSLKFPRKRQVEYSLKQAREDRSRREMDNQLAIDPLQWAWQ